MTSDKIVTARRAASLILLRDPLTAPSVLMGQRGAFHKFMPGRLVFPGGGVDAEDRAAPLAALPPADVMTRLNRQTTDEPVLAHGMLSALARELLEETGLDLGDPPDVSSVDLLCRAITPPSNPIRFDAFFFVAPAEVAKGVLAGSGELEELRWYPLEEALAFDLAWITHKVLLELKEWLALDAEARRARVKIKVMRHREWSLE